ncbi:MAG TPA: hypothetical protein VFG10_07790 [Saprospiraceae bacterium]|nr:hypothetical protein [Saprospiraceae bacterium]
MKNTVFSIIFICSIFIMMTTACERAELHKSLPNNDGLITLREIDDCSECPNETDCCCGIELQDVMSGSASLRICGTTDGAGSCSFPSPPSPCIAISGGLQSTGLLNFADPKHGFCMAPGNSFSVQNLTSSTAEITITCQDDVVNPQILTVSIPGNTTYFFRTTNGCVVGGCQ